MNNSDDFGYNEGKQEEYREEYEMADTENIPTEASEQKEFQKLDPKIITSWKIVRWIRAGFLIILLSVPTLILAAQEFFEVVAIPVLVIDAFAAAYLLITPFLYPLIEYRQWGYIITEDRVEIRHGIFFLQTTIIPVIRVQHVTISQGPINRKLGISTIEINTASGAFKIEGLSNANAKSIADSLKSKLLIRMKQQEKA